MLYGEYMVHTVFYMASICYILCFIWRVLTWFMKVDTAGWSTICVRQSSFFTNVLENIIHSTKWLPPGPPPPPTLPVIKYDLILMLLCNVFLWDYTFLMSLKCGIYLHHAWIGVWHCSNTVSSSHPWWKSNHQRAVLGSHWSNKVLIPSTKCWFKCWSTVSDAGPTLDQHWMNVPCSLGS